MPKTSGESIHTNSKGIPVAEMQLLDRDEWLVWPAGAYAACTSYCECNARECYFIAEPDSDVEFDLLLDGTTLTGTSDLGTVELEFVTELHGV